VSADRSKGYLPTPKRCAKFKGVSVSKSVQVQNSVPESKSVQVQNSVPESKSVQVQNSVPESKSVQVQKSVPESKSDSVSKFNTECWYGENCKKDGCKFKHGEKENNFRHKNLCFYYPNCKKGNACNFYHPEQDTVANKTYNEINVDDLDYSGCVSDDRENECLYFIYSTIYMLSQPREDKKRIVIDLDDYVFDEEFKRGNWEFYPIEVDRDASPCPSPRPPAITPSSSESESDEEVNLLIDEDYVPPTPDYVPETPEHLWPASPDNGPPSTEYGDSSPEL
jgi:hypothetical protein